MNKILIVILLSMTTPLIAQNEQVESRVYVWNACEVVQQENRETRKVLEGCTRDLEYFEVHATTIPAGKIPHPGHTHEDMEEMIIVKEGKLKVTLGAETKVLGTGSVVVALPGDSHSIYNAGETPATYYIIRFKSRKPLNSERGAKEGGSFAIDFNELEFKPHDKGGLWSYYRRSTAMFAYAEMHITQLNPGIKSHEPHIHGAAEIVLMISGNSEMQIGENYYQAQAGDLYYMESEVPHSIRNTGDEPCRYFAFQWE